MTKIYSIRVLSAAKVNGVLYGILGLLIAPFVLLGPGLALAGGERQGFGGSVVLAIFLPFVYACIGFLAGAVLAFIYNAISQAIGGIEVELLLPLPAIQNVTPVLAQAVEIPPHNQPPSSSTQEASPDE